MPLFPEKPTKDSYATLEESNKKIIEACYAAYRVKSEGKIWRKVNEQEIAICNDQNQPILMNEDVASMYAAGKTHSVNAWISFALSIAKESGEPTESMTKKAFEEVYKPAAGYTTYSGNPIPNFDELLDRQKTAWLAAAKAAFHEKELKPELSNLQSRP